MNSDIRVAVLIEKDGKFEIFQDMYKLLEDNFTCLWRLTLNGGFFWEKIKLYHTHDSSIQLMNKRGHSSCLVGSTLYIFGGIQGFNSFTNDLNIINIDVRK